MTLRCRIGWHEWGRWERFERECDQAIGIPNGTWYSGPAVIRMTIQMQRRACAACGLGEERRVDVGLC